MTVQAVHCTICNFCLCYRVNTDGKDSSWYAYWAESSGFFKQVFENNMDDSSYNHRDESLAKTVANSNQAYFGELKSIDNDMVCEVCLKINQFKQESFIAKKGCKSALLSSGSFL